MYSEDQPIRPCGLEGTKNYPGFGISKDVDSNELKEMARSLVANGLMIQQGSGYPTLAVSEQGKTFLKNRDRLTLSRPRQESPAQQNEPGDRETAYDTKLFDELAALRLEIATEREVPAYVIFSNKALQQMAFHSLKTSSRSPRFLELETLS
ncbi:MAG: hypothetical protein Ct9H300mP11_01910 [Chloroflexota bacterium]|nr:MAG: hypothetical protein Ct9H300mP11_01910 [Chloroflexota bacterium]